MSADIQKSHFASDVIVALVRVGRREGLKVQKIIGEGKRALYSNKSGLLARS